jgi:CBS domain-containing protein
VPEGLEDSVTVSAKKIRAKDLMQRDLVRLRPDTPIAEAVSTFEEYGIRGAPVVDESGRLLGVLSLSDVARSDHVDAGRIASETNVGAGFHDEEDEGEFDPDGYKPEVLGHATVSDWMRRETVAVTPEASLRELCEVMVREAVHRVLVVEGGKLVGLVSTTDVVRWVAEG